MNYLDRRQFLRGSSVAAAAASLTWPADLAAKAVPPSGGWDPGSVRHLLPTASDSRVLVKASFRTPLLEAPTLRIGGTSVRGRMTDTRGEFWQFATFPGPDEQPQSFRVLFYTCAGGHEAFAFLPAAVRNRLLRRGLSFAPAALVAIGDQVYWDLLDVDSRVISRTRSRLRKSSARTTVAPGRFAVPANTRGEIS